MRVLLTTDTIGGIWTFTRELTHGLLRAGHAVGLVSLGRLPDPSQTLWIETTARLHSEFAYFSSNAPLEWMSDNDRAWQDGAAIIRKAITLFGPDVLHSNQICFGQLQAGVPILVTAHSDVFSWARVCRPDGLDNSPWLRRYEKLVRKGIAGADSVTTPTAWMADAIEHHYRREVYVSTIPNGRTLTRPPEKKLLQAVTAGRIWDEAKGLDVLAELQTGLPIFLAGEETHERTSAPALPPHITHTGILAEADLLTLFSRSSFYLATSIYEPFGLAPLEAALCGCAILARDIPTFREVWGDAALYFHDATSLERLIASLTAAPDALHAAQTRSLARARTYTAERMTQSYLAEYDRLLWRSGMSATRSSEQVVHAV